MPEATFLDATELVINMGPQHPSTHGVLRVILKLDGEKVNGTECVIGYLHRGVEKIGENRTYQQFAPYVDRMDYVAAVSNGLGYCLAVEKLLNIEAPPRAQAVRVILTELNRIASHLLWLGTHALDIGAITPVFYCLREREEVLKIFENYCGARLTTHAFRIGGLQYETYDGFEEEVKKFCDWFIPKVDEYERLLTTNRIWVGRLKGVGILSADECKEYGVTGPVLRAAGVAWDLRKAQPYSGYEQYEFEIPIGENGDTYDRYTVRMEEMRQATRIIRQQVVAINRVTKVVKGGKNLSFAALVVVGDPSAGVVGYGSGKAKEVPQAIRKGIESAKKNLMKVSLTQTSIAHLVLGRYGSGKVLLKPAPEGTGVIAGGAVRAVMTSAGIQNVLTKSIGTTNPHNVIKATFDALRQLKSREGVAAMRGKTAQEL